MKPSVKFSLWMALLLGGSFPPLAHAEGGCLTGVNNGVCMVACAEPSQLWICPADMCEVAEFSPDYVATNCQLQPSVSPIELFFCTVLPSLIECLRAVQDMDRLNGPNNSFERIRRELEAPRR